MAKEYIERSVLREIYLSSKRKNTHHTQEASRIHQQEHIHVLDLLDKVPVADVVEVVRCGECVFYQPEYSGFGCSGAPYDFGKCTRFEFLSDEINARSQDDYCSFGERKDTNQ